MHEKKNYTLARLGGLYMMSAYMIPLLSKALFVLKKTCYAHFQVHHLLGGSTEKFYMH